MQLEKYSEFGLLNDHLANSNKDLFCIHRHLNSFTRSLVYTSILLDYVSKTKYFCDSLGFTCPYVNLTTNHFSASFVQICLC